jgi:hypothetical protein
MTNDEPVYPIDHDYSHVFPTNDLHEHILVGFDCPCVPKIVLEGASLIVVHNAFDRREIAEQRLANGKWN